MELLLLFFLLLLNSCLAAVINPTPPTYFENLQQVPTALHSGSLCKYFFIDINIYQVPLIYEKNVDIVLPSNYRYIKKKSY